MNIGFMGYDEKVLTFEADETVKKEGELLKMGSDGKVTVCGEGDKFFGVLLKVREGVAAVKVKGYVELRKTGEIGYGFCGIVADSDGKVKAESGGREHLVIKKDGDTIGIIL